MPYCNVSITLVCLAVTLLQCHSAPLMPPCRDTDAWLQPRSMPPCFSDVTPLSIEYNVSYIYHALYAYFDRQVAVIGSPLAVDRGAGFGRRSFSCRALCSHFCMSSAWLPPACFVPATFSHRRDNVALPGMAAYFKAGAWGVMGSGKGGDQGREGRKGLGSKTVTYTFHTC